MFNKRTPKSDDLWIIPMISRTERGGTNGDDGGGGLTGCYETPVTGFIVLRGH